MSVTFGPKLGRLINASISENYVDDFRAFLRAFDQLVMPSALDNSLAAPPSLPNNGDAYIVASGATGAWLYKDNLVAVYSTEITNAGTNTKVPAWEFYVPAEGWRVWCVSLSTILLYTGGAWVALQPEAVFVDEVVPTGTVDPAVFTLPSIPNPISSTKLYLGGQRMKRGVDFTGDADYTLVGDTITYRTAPGTTSVQVCDYRTVA